MPLLYGERRIMTQEQAKEIVYTHEIDKAMEIEGEDIKENNYALYEAYLAILKLAGIAV